jgi:hypothetical protein
MRFKLRNIAFAAVVYVWIAALLIQLDAALLVVAAGYMFACMGIANGLIRGAERRRAGKTIEFNQEGAVEHLGHVWACFHHVFYSKADVVGALRERLATALRDRLGCSMSEDVSFTDVDGSLDGNETRVFLRANAPETCRKTGLTFVCTFTRSADVQGVRWWILVEGRRDPNKVFWRYAFAPFTVPLVLWPYWRRRYNPLQGLCSVYPGFFNSVDVFSRAREIQFVAFETLVETLGSFGIDTSDLKQQRANVLNINVTGKGKASFANVVQGALNRVTSGGEAAAA